MKKTEHHRKGVPPCGGQGPVRRRNARLQKKEEPHEETTFEHVLRPGPVPGLAAVTALAADEVSYLAYSWDGSKLTSEMKSVTDYTLVASTDTAWGAAGETTWYVADGDVSISNRVDVNGSVNLLLKDDCELSPDFIIISAGSTLTIYAQTEGETAGKLVCNGIGTVGSTLIIHGGTVNATGTIARRHRRVGADVNRAAR